MKNLEVKRVLNDVKILDDLIGADFTMAVVDNLELMESKIKGVEAIIKPSKEYENLMKLRDDMFKKYADVGEDGKMIIKDKQYIITNKDNLAKYSKDIELLLNDKDNIKVSDIHDKKVAEYNKAMDMDCGIKFNVINSDQVPDNISVKQRRLIKFMIK